MVTSGGWPEEVDGDLGGGLDGGPGSGLVGGLDGGPGVGGLDGDPERADENGDLEGGPGRAEVEVGCSAVAALGEEERDEVREDLARLVSG